MSTKFGPEAMVYFGPGSQAYLSFQAERIPGRMILTEDDMSEIRRSCGSSLNQQTGECGNLATLLNALASSGRSSLYNQMYTQIPGNVIANSQNFSVRISGLGSYDTMLQVYSSALAAFHVAITDDVAEDIELLSGADGYTAVQLPFRCGYSGYLSEVMAALPVEVLEDIAAQRRQAS